MHQSTASHLGRPCKEKFHYGQEPTGLSAELGLTKARIEEIDDDEGLAAVLDSIRQFTAIEHLKEFGNRISISHIGRLLIVQSLEDVCTALFRERRVAVNFGGDDGQIGRYVEPCCRFLELWQDHEGEKEGTDDILALEN